MHVFSDLLPEDYQTGIMATNTNSRTCYFKQFKVKKGKETIGIASQKSNDD